MKLWQEKMLLAIMWVVVFPAMIFGALMFLDLVVKGYSKYLTEHDRCLKNATNGYEIRQCR